MKLYQTVYCTPSRVLGLLRLLASQHPQHMSEQEISDFMLPPSRREAKDADKARQIIDAALESGFVIPSGPSRNQRYSLASALIENTSPPDITARFPIAAAMTLLAPALPDGRSNRFAEFAAWMLCLAPGTVPDENAQIQHQLTQSGMSVTETGLNMRDPSRVDMALYWLRYLGLYWQASEKSPKVIPDPSEFIINHIDKLFPTGTTLAAEKFRQRLGELCPVLDGGVVRNRMLEQLQSHGTGVVVPPADEFSPATSFALRRLARQKLVRYWCPNDQKQFLMLSGGEKIAFLERGKDVVP